MLIERLKSLSLAGLELWLEGERLRYRAPDALLTPALLAELKAHKDEIVTLLQQTSEAIRAYPLSYGQRALWFIHEMDETADYNVAFAAQIHSALDVAALCQTFEVLADRHPLLRSCFPQLNGEPVREELLAEIDFCQIDARGWSQEELMGQLRAAQSEPFDLVTGPVMRVRLFTQSETDHTLLLAVHHIACDGHSFAILLGDLRVLYPVLAAGRTVSLPSPDYGYGDYVRWQEELLNDEQAGSEGKRLWHYWRDQLAGELPTLELPSDHLRPPLQSFHGADYSFVLDTSTLQRVKALAQQEGATPFMVLLAIFQILLHRYTEQEDIVVGVPTVGRTHSEFAQVVGYFVNPIVLRTNLAGSPSYQDLLAQVRRHALDGMSHQDYPFPLLVERLQPVRDPSRSPLFQVAYVYQRIQQRSDVARLMTPEEPAETIDWGGLMMTPIELVQQAGVFDLELEIREGAGGLSCCLKYNRDLFEGETIVRMAHHFQRLLDAVLERPTTPIAKLPLLTAVETQQLLVDWNATSREFPVEQCLHQLIEAQVERTPDAVAVVYVDNETIRNNSRDDTRSVRTVLTYQELNRRANRLARQLIAQGVGSDTVVALLAERNHDFLTAILAIFKAGGAYMPLDPKHPSARLETILAQSQPGLLLVGRQATASLPLPIDDLPSLVLEDALAVDDATVDLDANLPLRCAPEHLAYVLFTSGSTGLPKGVMIEHRGKVNHLCAMIDELELTERDTIVQNAGQTFDISVWQFLTALLVGGKVHIVGDAIARDPQQLLAHVQEDGVTVLELVPSLLRPLLREAEEDAVQLDKLRWLIPTGESLPPDLVTQWFAAYPQIPMINAYGPAECADDVTLYQLENAPKSDSTTIPIGRPIANMRLYVLDQNRSPVPIGVPGELYIAGIGLGRGYLNDPDRTAQSFLSVPELNEERLYRSGDLVRYLPDGNLEFLGRIDHQVKLRGFRIELSEIEATLATNPDVDESVVVIREDVAGSQQLTAYVVPTDTAAVASTPLPILLQEWLATQLPEYMVPAQLVLLETLPLAPSGKIDRKALPAPTRQVPDAEFIAPQTPAESILAAIWADLLHLPQVGVHENFFALGGDSILSIQVVAKAKQQGLGLNVQQVMQHQTIAKLAAVADTVVLPHAMQAAIVGPVRLTPIQQWFFEQAMVEPHHYNQSVLLETDPSIVPTQLEGALRALLNYHDVLRLRFTQTDIGWQQEHLAPNLPFTLTVVDLGEMDPAAQEQKIDEIADVTQASLRLECGDVMRAVLFQKGLDRPGGLLLVIHHLAVDGISWRILLEDLATAYRQLVAGESVQLPPKTTSYQTWAEEVAGYAQRDTMRKEVGFWLNTLQTNYPTLPQEETGTHCAAHERNCEAAVDVVSITLAAKETALLLKEVPSVYNTQTDEVLLAALLGAYAAWSGDNELLLELESHGRQELFPHVDLSRTVGWFTALSPILLRLENDVEREPGEVLKAVKEQVRQVPQRGIGYGLLRYLSEDAEIRRVMEQLPQPQVIFNYLGQFESMVTPDAPFRLLPASVGNEHSPQAERPHQLEINAFILGGQLQVQWHYSRHLHSATTMGKLADNFLEQLHTLIAHCQSPDAGGYTKSDFPYAPVDEQEFAHLADLLMKI